MDDKARDLLRTRIEQACVDDLSDEQLEAIGVILHGGHLTRLAGRCGRPLPWALRERIRDLQRDGERPSAIARAVGVSRPTVYRYLEKPKA